MSEKQLLHEINSSREATEEIRKQVLKAKQKGYFSSTEFGRHFLSIFVPDFAKELLQTLSIRPKHLREIQTNTIDSL